MRTFIERGGPDHPPHHSYDVVILVVLADAGQRVQDLDAVRPQDLPSAYAGQFEKLRRLNGARYARGLLVRSFTTTPSTFAEAAKHSRGGGAFGQEALVDQLLHGLGDARRRLPLRGAHSQRAM